MAGVTGVVMTLSLILMISSATELIRFAFNCLKLTFFKLFESLCIDEGAVFLTQLLILCICHWSLWTKIFLLRAAVVYFWSETLIQKFMSQQLKSLQKVLLHNISKVDGKCHCLMLCLIYSSMQEILLWDLLVHSPFVCCLLWLPCCAWHWVITHFIVSAIT